jgi:hypothetical protein
LVTHKRVAESHVTTLCGPRALAIDALDADQREATVLNKNIEELEI